MQERHVDITGKRIKLLTGGDPAATPLLYLHSAGGETLWLPFHDGLAAHFHLHAPAHPGFDSSGGLDQIDSIEDLAFHYLDFIDAMGWREVNVVGLSMGGWIGAELACRWPERVRRLVLVDAAGLHVDGAPMQPLWDHTRDHEHMRRLIFADPTSMMAELLIPPFDDAPEQLLELGMKAAEAAARVAWNPYFENPKLRGRLRRIKSPTLVLWGELDRLIPLAHGRAYAELIPGARLEVIPNCGHMPVFEATEVFCKAVTEFCK